MTTPKTPGPRRRPPTRRRTSRMRDRPAFPCYPDYLMDFPPNLAPEQVRRWRRFFDLREDILLDYGYQTARAYWTDLQDIFEWAVARDKDVLALTNRDLRQYCALLRRRKYSEATIRRRMVAWRKMEEKMKEE